MELIYHLTIEKSNEMFELKALCEQPAQVMIRMSWTLRAITRRAGLNEVNSLKQDDRKE